MDKINPELKKLELQMKERINFEGKIIDYLLNQETKKNGRKEETRE